MKTNTGIDQDEIRAILSAVNRRNGGKDTELILKGINGEIVKVKPVGF